MWGGEEAIRGHVIMNVNIIIIIISSLLSIYFWRSTIWIKADVCRVNDVQNVAEPSRRL